MHPVLAITVFTVLVVTGLSLWSGLSWPKEGRSYPVLTRLRIGWSLSSAWEKDVDAAHLDDFRKYRRRTAIAYLGIAIVLGGVWLYAEMLGREADELEREYEKKYGPSGQAP
jgi:hypothetical protein